MPPVVAASPAASLRAPQRCVSAPARRGACVASRLSSRRSRALGACVGAAAARRVCAARQASLLAPRAGAPRVEVASRRDFADVADAFVDAFFLDGQTDALDGSSRARLGRAALNDLEGRYSSRRVHARANKQHLPRLPASAEGPSDSHRFA